MKDRTCKDCIHYDDSPGIPGRCKLVLDFLDEKAKDGSATVSELEYLTRGKEYDDEYWSCTCKEFKYKQGAEPISLTPDEVRDLWWYIYSLHGYTVHIESALRGKKVFDRIDAELKTGLEIERLKAFDKLFCNKEDSECGTQEKEEQ